MASSCSCSCFRLCTASRCGHPCPQPHQHRWFSFRYSDRVDHSTRVGGPRPKGRRNLKTLMPGVPAAATETSISATGETRRAGLLKAFFDALRAVFLHKQRYIHPVARHADLRILQHIRTVRCPLPYGPLGVADPHASSSAPLWHRLCVSIAPEFDIGPASLTRLQRDQFGSRMEHLKAEASRPTYEYGVGAKCLPSYGVDR